MKQIIAMLALLVLLAGCIPDNQKPQVSFAGASPVTVDKQNITVSFTATDNRDLVMNYVVFIDATQVGSGQATNGTQTAIPLTLPDKESSIIKVSVMDKYLNVGQDQVIVYLKDNKAPVVTIVSVIPR